MSFCKRLAKRRHELDLTQQELANKIGVSRPTINAWENPLEEDVFPNSKNLMKLAEALNVEPAWLRFGDPHFQPKDDILPIALPKNSFIIPNAPILKTYEIGGWLESKRNILQKGIHMSAVERKEVLFEHVIEGDAMVNVHEGQRSLYPGDSVVVDPSCTGGINSGDIVMAQFGGISDNYKARIYYRDGLDAYLVGINPQAKRIEINDNVRIVGKVIRVYRNTVLNQENSI